MIDDGTQLFNQGSEYFGSDDVVDFCFLIISACMDFRDCFSTKALT